MLARELLWSAAHVRGLSTFEKFVADFRPQVILVQAGDSIFMLRLALALSKAHSAPLLVYNSEDYFFKKSNYLDDRNNRASAPLYRIWHRVLRRAIRATFRHASHVFYSCSPLQQTFSDLSNAPSSVLLTSTEISPRTTTATTEAIDLVYTGNLGLGRLEALLEVASVAHDINRAAVLRIFGPPPTAAVLATLASAPAVRYCGLVDQSTVIKAITSSHLNIHVESFNPAYRAQLTHAFSTKIADYLATGTCLFAYAPPEIASTQYLKETQSAIVADSPENLRPSLQKAMREPRMRACSSARAIEVAETNHSATRNNYHFREIAIQAARGHSGSVEL
ncbi:glycosyltransferase [Nocardioides sp. cx-169]|uniref:glycosyltransferase family protein n=1 Tax=Nocardioides sp. cx-169 TaxID=2899080 RepID=UPI001E34CB4B|nr:glycosyltransferase [Nocardioides sp. cx-169]